MSDSVGVLLPTSRTSYVVILNVYDLIGNLTIVIKSEVWHYRSWLQIGNMRSLLNERL